MRPVSEAFARTVKGSHRMVARARVCETFQSTTDPDGIEITIMAGDVVSDALADLRATMDLVTDGTAAWPTRADDLLAPYGNEVYIERGVVFDNGSSEYVGLGYFRIDQPEQDRPKDGPIAIRGSDRMAGILDGRLLTPVQFGTSATYGAVMEQLVTEVYPDALIEWDDSQETTAIGRAVIASDDRFRFLDQMVSSLGKIWYWDYRGRLQVKAQPTTAVVDAEIMAGEGGVLVSSSRRLSRIGVYNAVVVTGQGADTEDPARAVAIDANPDSPTYYSGRFGPVPQFFTSAFVTDFAGASVSASALLQRSLGLPYEVDFAAVPNPALEPWDCVRIRHHTREGTTKHQLRRIAMPLTPDGVMTAETKEQTVVLIEVT